MIERERFEAWALSNKHQYLPLSITHDVVGTGYHCEVTDMLWEGWKACSEWKDPLPIVEIHHGEM